jgi:hypothetical protein
VIARLRRAHNPKYGLLYPEERRGRQANAREQIKK